MTVARLNGFYAPEFLAEGRQRFPVGTLATGMDRSARAVEISDARALQAGEGLSEAAFFARHSFVLLPHASAVSDWDNDIAAVYLPEIGRVVRERLFPGQRVEIQQQPNVLRRGRETLTPEYADGVHSDGGLDLDDYIHNIGAFANEQAAQWWRALYERKDVVGVVWIDFWRTTNMTGPLKHMPLALCDPTTVAPQDLIPVAMTGIAPSARESHHLSLRFNANQR
ncbi:MAG: UDP-sugar pyrophosphorylase, partial [Sphingomonadales bacterium]|nr:UDP-sugar pyrophosphorylase [Sphingomonadales bacterium]